MIIDFHTHIFPPEFRKDRSQFFYGEPGFRMIYDSSKARLVGVEELLNHMEQCGIQKSVVFGFPWEKYENFKRHNDYILEAIARYPNRLIGFCCFSPLAPKGAREAERCISSGLSGVGELAVYAGEYNQSVIEALRDVMCVCKEKDVPVLIHTNEPVGHNYAGKAPMTLKQIYDIARQYHENRIIFAHWGGGLVFYGLMKKQVREVLKNVWFDTAASPFLYTPDVYRIASSTIGCEKILFGTDFPLLPARRYLREIENAGISDYQRDRILGTNAQDLLGIS